MDLVELEKAMCSGQILYAVLDREGRVLHAAPDDDAFRPHTDFPEAAAAAAGGTQLCRPQIFYPCEDRPVALIRTAVGRGWSASVLPGWVRPQLSSPSSDPRYSRACSGDGLAPSVCLPV